MSGERSKNKGGFISKLSVKFILIFTLLLFGTFLLVGVVAGVSAKAYTDKYVTGASASMRDDIDSGITETLDEIAYAYSQIRSEENRALVGAFADAVTQGARRSAFVALMNGSGIADGNGMQLLNVMDVGYKDGVGYNSYSGLSQPHAEVFEQAAGDDEIGIGGYESGCVLLVVRPADDFAMNGIFVFFLAETAFSEIYGAMGGETAYFFIVRSDGFVISHDDKSYVGKTLYFDDGIDLSNTGVVIKTEIRGEKKAVTVRALPRIAEEYTYDLSLVGVMDYDFYYGRYDTLMITLISIAVGFLAVGIVMAVIRAKKITRPVANLSKAINDVVDAATIGEAEDVNRHALAPMNEGDEIYQLEQNYDEMINRIFALMKKEKADMETQRKLELDALQMQINPHFLYNTLDAIVWIARINKQTEIENLVVNLASFFRLSLHRGDRFITVGEELEIVKHYFEIERTRFPDRATLTVDMDESVKKYKTLKLLLQPVVENALKYAFTGGSGEINVSVKAEGEYIVYRVRDNGAGFDVPEGMPEYPDGGESEKKLSGYGLFNVNRRVRLEYGEDCGLSVESQKGVGTVVTIRIAKRIA